MAQSKQLSEIDRWGCMARWITYLLLVLSVFLPAAVSALPRVIWIDVSDGSIHHYDGTQTITHQVDSEILGQGLTYSDTRLYYSSVTQNGGGLYEIKTSFEDLQEVGLTSYFFRFYTPARGLAISADGTALIATQRSEVAHLTRENSSLTPESSVAGYSCNGVEFDEVNGKMYWVDSGMFHKVNGANDYLARADIDGSNQEILASVLGGRDIALDNTNAKIYWADNSAAPTIKRAALDGSSVETIISTGISFVTGLDIDEANEKLYWLDLPSGKIQRSDLDGSNIEDVVTDIAYGVALAVVNDECPADDNKIGAGVCGCGVADTDTDGDATADCLDGCASDAAKTAPGICGCGVADTDTDSDGTADCNDSCPSDGAKLTPGICGCGVADADSDSDGTADCNDGCPADVAKLTAGACGCGVADTDSDSDGTANCNDGCATDAAKTAPGICGCGVSDADSDSDGTVDCNESCPGDAAKLEPGVCGCGVADIDVDNNNLFDCLEDPAIDPPAPKAPESIEEARELSQLGALIAGKLRRKRDKAQADHMRGYLAEIAAVLSSVASETQYAGRSARVMTRFSRVAEKLSEGKNRGKRYKRKLQRVRRVAKRLSRLFANN